MQHLGQLPNCFALQALVKMKDIQGRSFITEVYSSTFMPVGFVLQHGKRITATELEGTLATH